jgi:hypothetical protein
MMVISLKTPCLDYSCTTLYRDTPVIMIGGVTIKKTTNKIWLTLRFSQNQIRGLAVCLLFFFFEGASRAFKNEALKRESSFGKGRLLRCAPLPILLIISPPPPIGTRSRPLKLIPPPRFERCSGRGAKLAHATASRDFYLGFFPLQTCACGCKLVRAGSHDA